MDDSDSAGQQTQDTGQFAKEVQLLIEEVRR